MEQHPIPIEAEYLSIPVRYLSVLSLNDAHGMIERFQTPPSVAQARGVLEKRCNRIRTGLEDRPGLGLGRGPRREHVVGSVHETRGPKGVVKPDLGDRGIYGRVSRLAPARSSALNLLKPRPNVGEFRSNPALVVPSVPEPLRDLVRSRGLAHIALPLNVPDQQPPSTSILLDSVHEHEWPVNLPLRWNLDDTEPFHASR